MCFLLVLIGYKNNSNRKRTRRSPHNFHPHLILLINSAYIAFYHFNNHHTKNPSHSLMTHLFLFWRMERSKPWWLILFVAALLCLSVQLSASLNDEGRALWRFREKVEVDPYGALSNWVEEAVDSCSWFGVECSDDGRVVAFDASFGYPGGPLLFENLNFGIDLDSRIANRGLQPRGDHNEKNAEQDSEEYYILKVVNFLWQPEESSYQHIWPEIKFGWQIVVGSVIGFFGAAFGSVGGVGGGGIFVPMLTLIIGFDAKSSTAISKCMIMGAAGSTVYYNLKLRHPTLDMPIIDYDLALLFQPMLMLGISIGVAFNVIFADWMVTVLLIFLFIGTSSKAFIKGIETWKKETLVKKEAAKLAISIGGEEADYKALPSDPSNAARKETRQIANPEVPILQNVCWKELGLLFFVWVAFLGIQITKNYTSTCSKWYWILNLLQVPVSVGVTLYEAVGLFKGRKVIASKGDEGTDWKVARLFLYCLTGVLAGLVGGLLGLGGGFILGPLFLELGIPPQVSSATATFAMTFSASMSVVEYYLLKRFPVPYALYFTVVATCAAFIGQHAVRKLINILGRASLIIFILAFTIFVSAISLGGVGISNIVQKVRHNDYMGFDNLCKYQV